MFGIGLQQKLIYVHEHVLFFFKTIQNGGLSNRVLQILTEFSN